MVNRSVFDIVGWFDPSLIRYEDWDWLLRYVDQFPLTVLPEPLAIVKRSSRAPAHTVESAAERFLEKHSKDFYRFGRFYARKAIAKRWLELAVYFAVERKAAKSFHYLFKTLFLNPFQRPSMYVRILDGFLGTSFIAWALRFRNSFLSGSGHIAASF
jgi:hypothetical protein